MAEISRQLAAAEIAALQATDRGVGIVVPDHPYGRDAVFDGCAKDTGVHEKGTVAAHRNAGSVGRGELRAENASDAEPHRSKAHIRSARPAGAACRTVAANCG